MPPDDDIAARFSTTVRRIRLNGGIRLTDVARQAGMTDSQWAKIENRPRKDIGLVLFMRVADALSLSGTQLLAIIERTHEELASSGN